MQPSVIKDKTDADAARRYKMICWLRDQNAYHTMISPDGLHWKQFSAKPISPGGDNITGFYDQQRSLYVAFPKIVTKVRGHNRRVFYLITSKDFQQWTEPKLTWVPDLRDDAGSLRRIEEARPVLDVKDHDPKLMQTCFYSIGFYPHESCVVAFPWIFTINNHIRYSLGGDEGPCEVQLAVSRDLEHWERPFRVPCLPRGKPGEWDSGWFWTANQALRVGDEIWLYYGGANFTHGNPCLYLRFAFAKAKGLTPENTGRGTKYWSGIGLAKWKLDRFVSVDGPAEGGTLTTVPLVFSGERLEINARVKPGGNLSVEVVDAGGRPIKGWGMSKPFHGDNLRHVVTWPGDKTVAALRGQPISLKFHLKSAELYSFAFRDKIRK